jgi:hypothetical protein
MSTDPYLDSLEVANTEMESGMTVEEAAESALYRRPDISEADRRVLRKKLIADLNKGKNLPRRKRRI